MEVAVLAVGDTYVMRLRLTDLATSKVLMEPVVQVAAGQPAELVTGSANTVLRYRVEVEERAVRQHSEARLGGTGRSRASIRLRWQ